MRIRHGALCCAVLLCVGACGDVPLAPQSIAGTYVLSAVDGEPVPVVVATDPANAIVLVADTLRLRLAGNVEGRRCQRRIDYVNENSTDSCSDYGGSYRVHVRTIEVAIGCLLGQVCTVVAMHTATLHGDALVMTSGEPGGSLTFRRVPE